ncbi:MAG: trypsin-like peptidase domain-containing protein, partial [Elusimicrobia bacterium]|nr:trypsin-like peptidase domain-containing protein [Elusimicrobiota bacterium]
LVRLSRPVDPGRRPAFEIDRGPMPKVGTPLLMIGHPMGLPVKIADGARVTSQGKGFFYADLDAYRGNSGSPVLSRDGVVEGIMVSYPQANMNDFVVSLGQDNSTICMKSTVIPDAGRSGMIVFPIRYLASKIPELRRAARRFQPDERGLRLLGSLTDMP